MRRKLYSSRRVKTEGLIYTPETEELIAAAKEKEEHERSPALIRVLYLIDNYKTEELCLN